MEAGLPATSSSPLYVIGAQYLHAKTRAPITLKYIGPLPPASTESNPMEAPQQIWYGVEYDDPAKGKGHSGSYDGFQVFQTRQDGAGSFIKAGRGQIFELGKTFVEAVINRYGPLHPAAESSSSIQSAESIILGSSGSAIVVDAPKFDDVKRRVGRLEKLREMGLEGEWIRCIGGNDETRELLRERLKGRNGSFLPMPSSYWK